MDSLEPGCPGAFTHSNYAGYGVRLWLMIDQRVMLKMYVNTLHEESFWLHVYHMPVFGSSTFIDEQRKSMR